jgi:hypothetical protein
VLLLEEEPDLTPAGMARRNRGKFPGSREYLSSGAGSCRISLIETNG